MNYGFWEKLPRPFFVLAPMANVTDTVFRRLIATYSRPHVMFTEFVSCDGLSSRGRERLLPDLQFVKGERPIVAQIFGAKPENFYKTAHLACELGFDGIDINMGCPDKAVVRQGAGANLIRNPSLAQEIIKATQEGVADAGAVLPVSVKTRIGFSTDEIDTWIPTLLSMKLPVLTIHGRTRKEMSLVPAKWDRIAEVVRLAQGSGTLIVGNGDVQSVADAREKAAASGVDGVMLGRAIFGNPWLFSDTGRPKLPEILRVLVEHTALYEQVWGETKPFDLMKKHFKAYVTGFPGAHELRLELMASKNADQVASVVKRWLEVTTLSARSSEPTPES